VIIPKLFPPPLKAQKISGWEEGVTCRREELERMREKEVMVSQDQPWDWEKNDIPPIQRITNLLLAQL